MAKDRFSIGLDFGTESARGVLVNVETGETVAGSVSEYRSGVIDRALPGSKVSLPLDWALQDPEDYRTSVARIIPALLKSSKIRADQVVGIGVDFTACTVLPALRDGTPLCALPRFRREPHAWAKLWKHHAADPQADRINEVARERREAFLPRYGGAVSCEWLLPKALQILDEAPRVYGSAEKLIEAQDWIVWQLTGRERRSLCGAGYKALWSRKQGFPSPAYLKAVRPGFEKVSQKTGAEFFHPGERAGGLTPEWAVKTGLNPGTPVGVAVIDAHAAVLGAGVAEAGKMVMCLGTSACHLLLGAREKNVEGICGVVKDGIVPGLYGYEAGQASFGDVLAWFVKTSRTDYRQLENAAASLRAGQSGLLALDWWNGNRSVLVNAKLSGVILGLTSATQPQEIYRTLIEALAMGSRAIVDAFERQKIPVRELIATGGIVEKSPLLVQILSDVTGRPIRVPQGTHLCAQGAAILGAAAADPRSMEPPRFRSLVRRMGSRRQQIFRPRAAERKVYESLYREYQTLHDYFGRGANRVLERLKALKIQSQSAKN